MTDQTSYEVQISIRGGLAGPELFHFLVRMSPITFVERGVTREYFDRALKDATKVALDKLFGQPHPTRSRSTDVTL